MWTNLIFFYFSSHVLENIVAFSPSTRRLRPCRNLYGVLSPSQIVRASSNVKKRPTYTAPVEESRAYFHLVLEEIKFRQHRILDALELELRKENKPSGDGSNKSLMQHEGKANKKREKIMQRNAEILLLLDKVQQIEESLKPKRHVSFTSVRHSIIRLGFESILTESTDNWKSQRTSRNEFGRPKGYDGLIFYTPLGTPILVGIQGSHSDETLRQISQGMDLWFQVEGYSGSRILLRTSLKRSLKGSKSCIQMAADLAAYYSDHRWEKEVPIMYTDPRHVAKRGTKAGQMKKRKSFGCIIGHPTTVSHVTEGKEPF